MEITAIRRSGTGALRFSIVDGFGLKVRSINQAGKNTNTSSPKDIEARIAD